jgi:hypothetical protein
VHATVGHTSNLQSYVSAVLFRISTYPLRDRLTSYHAFLAVYLLTSFIDAHEEAQTVFIRTLSGVDITEEESMLVEQQKVLAESRESVS